MIPLVGAGIGALISAGSNYLGSEIESSKNKELMKYQNEMNIANWERQNEYNLPSNQMARLKQAGLNPNLVYGNGATTTAGSVSAPSRSDYKAPNLDVIGKYLEYTLLDKKKEVMETQANVNKADYLKKGAEYSNLIDYGEGIRLENERKREQLPYQAQIIESQLNKTNAEIRQLSANTDNLLFDYGVKNDIRPELIRKATLENQRIYENIQLMKSQGRLNAQQAENLQVVHGNLLRDALLKNQVYDMRALEMEFTKLGLDKGLVTNLRPIFSDFMNNTDKGSWR